MWLSLFVQTSANFRATDTQSANTGVRRLRLKKVDFVLALLVVMWIAVVGACGSERPASNFATSPAATGPAREIAVGAEEAQGEPESDNNLRVSDLVSQAQGRPRPTPRPSTATPPPPPGGGASPPPATGTPASPGPYFKHIATSTNSVRNYTQINSYASNGSPDKLVFVTHAQDPRSGGSNIHNHHPIGVWFTGTNWAIFNQVVDQQLQADARYQMPLGIAFNVHVLSPSSNAFVHQATRENVYGPATRINHPRSNRNPNALLIVTQNFNPGGGSGVYNTFPIAVYYEPNDGYWYVYNRTDGRRNDNMPIGASFNVLVAEHGSQSFVHRADPSNTSGSQTLIDSGMTNGHPSVGLLVTNNLSANPSRFSMSEVGVFLRGNGREARWGVFNESQTSMANTAFNVLVLADVVSASGLR